MKIEPTALGKYLASSAFQFSQGDLPTYLNVRDAATFKLELFCLQVFMAEFTVRLVWPDGSSTSDQILDSLYAQASEYLDNGRNVLIDRCTVYGKALNNLPERTSIGVHLGTTMIKAIGEDDIANRAYVGLLVSRLSIALKEQLNSINR